MADGTPLVADILGNLHLKRDSPPLKGHSTITQENVGTADVLAQLMKNSSNSIDFFGFRPDFIVEISGTPFAAALARTSAFFANGQLPALTNRALLAGSLTALNKIAPGLQGTHPKIRPVNSGSLLSKAGAKAVKARPSCITAIESLPFQYGLKKGGADLMAHRFRIDYARGCPIFGGDAINAFQELNRSNILEQVAIRWPEATNIANLMYGQPSLVIFTFVDEKGLLHVRLISSEEGTRMGCVFGSLLYDIGVAPLHDKLVAKYPYFHLGSLTDDILTAAPPPHSDTEWQDFYRRYVEYLADFQTWGEPMGYRLHPDKLFLLLPTHAPPMDETTRALLPPNLLITREGCNIAGAFIGTNEYIKRELETQALGLLDKLKKVEIMGRLQPQIALRLINHSIVTALIYSCRVNPPSCMRDCTLLVDAAIQKCRLSILSDPSSPPGLIDEVHLDRANTIASLPWRDGGLGQTPLAVLCSPAYLSSLAASSRDPFVARHLFLLQDEITVAQTDILNMIGDDPHALEQVRCVLPPTDCILDDSFSLLYLKTNLRIQSILVNAILLSRKNKLMKSVSDTDHPPPGLTKEGVTLILIAGNFLASSTLISGTGAIGSKEEFSGKRSGHSSVFLQLALSEIRSFRKTTWPILMFAGTATNSLIPLLLTLQVAPPLEVCYLGFTTG